MTERRTLDAGARPTTPFAPPDAARRARLAAEAAEAPRTPAQAPAAALRPSGRRQLGTCTAAR
ncbi:hypothetical protein ACFCXT_38355 [Streptomyces vinaceus]|uniref:hypothetical protein n=1 Tax=Streptomyces vinaceus TaxID=1960 RepID=UPI0035D8D077